MSNYRLGGMFAFAGNAEAGTITIYNICRHPEEFLAWKEYLL